MQSDTGLLTIETVEFLSLKNQKGLIEGAKLIPLTFHRDPRGFLVETLKETWTDVFRRPDLQFGQSYCSMTIPGFARDEDQWHNHPTKQTDRFVVMKGSAVFALFDWRKESPTHNVLNLFLMGQANSDDNQFLLLIPKNVLHGFTTIGKEPCYLLGFPDHVYDPAEEGRIQMQEVGATFSDGLPFSWKTIREHFQTEKASSTP